MAFPVVRNRTESPGGTAGTTLTLNFGTNVAGDLCVIFIALNDTAQTITTTESFINWTNTSATFHIIYKILDGTEGTSTTVTVGTSTRWAGIAYTIESGTHARSIAPAISTVATGTSTAPDATSCAPTGSAKDYLWISAFRQNGEEADDDTWTTAAPTAPGTFTNLLQKTTSTTGLPATNGSLASAEYQANATSVDAGAFTVAQSLAWRAYTIAIYPTMSGSFTANANIVKRVESSFTANALLLKNSGTKTFTADAWRLRNSGTLTFSSDAVLLRNSGTKTFTVDTVLFGSSGTKTFTADALLLRGSGELTFSSDAVLLRSSGDQALTADTVIFAPSGEKTFAADAVVLKSLEQTLTSDAVIVRVEEKTYPADAVVFRSWTVDPAASVDALVLRTGIGALTADADLFGERTGTFDADALLAGDQTTACVWTYPSDGDPMPATPELRFLSPVSVKNLYFWLELDKVDTFDSANLRRYVTNQSQSGWSYWDGGSWQAMPAEGMPSASSGNEAKLIVSDPLMGGTWYRRVRAGVI